jgi:hypothetical protein
VSLKPLAGSDKEKPENKDAADELLSMPRNNSLRALRDIQVGEELRIAYVSFPKHASWQERYEALGFYCTCPHCQDEALTQMTAKKVRVCTWLLSWRFIGGSDSWPFSGLACSVLFSVSAVLVLLSWTCVVLNCVVLNPSVDLVHSRAANSAL